MSKERYLVGRDLQVSDIQIYKIRGHIVVDRVIHLQLVHQWSIIVVYNASRMCASAYRYEQRKVSCRKRLTG